MESCRVARASKATAVVTDAATARAATADTADVSSSDNELWLRTTAAAAMAGNARSTRNAVDHGRINAEHGWK